MLPLPSAADHSAARILELGERPPYRPHPWRFFSLPPQFSVQPEQLGRDEVFQALNSSWQNQTIHYYEMNRVYHSFNGVVRMRPDHEAVRKNQRKRHKRFPIMKPKELKRRTNEEWTDAGRTTGASGSGPTNSIAFQYCVCFVFMDGEKNFNQE